MEKTTKIISVITPTYNRQEQLKRVYQSLTLQTNKNFEWLVIDDGSVDNTKSIINKFKKENKIEIKCFFQENSGKPSAYNLGVREAVGQLIICLDSDDALVKDAIEIITRDYNEIATKKNIAGLVYNNINMDNDNLVGSELPNNTIDTYYNMYAKYKVKGDKTQVIKKEVAQKYPFPIIKGEKFVTEALVNNRISLTYNFLYKNVAVKRVEYLDNGYSANYFNLVKKNPLSNRLYFKELYDYKKSFYNVYGYILFSIYGKIKFKEMLKEHKAKFKIIILYIPVLLISKVK